MRLNGNSAPANGYAALAGHMHEGEVVATNSVVATPVELVAVTLTLTLGQLAIWIKFFVVGGNVEHGHGLNNGC